MFLLAPFGCVYYPIETLPEFFQKIAYLLPLVYIFEEARSILIDQSVNYENIIKAFYFNGIYLVMAVSLFYYSFSQARKKGTLINIGE
jgi:ABC-2 type transport system permease protein